MRPAFLYWILTFWLGLMILIWLFLLDVIRRRCSDEGVFCPLETTERKRSQNIYVTQPTRFNGLREKSSGPTLWSAAIAISLLVLLSASPSLARGAEPQAAMPDVASLGPQVGARVPDFTLSDHTGRSRTLMSLMGPKGLMLVFIRSADW